MSENTVPSTTPDMASNPYYYDEADSSPPYYLSAKIKLAPVPGKDLGIIAVGPIAKDEVIECCPVILLKYEKEMKWSFLKRFYKAAVVAVFDDYLWWWQGRKQALLLGYGNLYNHSDNFNALSYRKEGRKFIFVAARDIAAGEEITVHYGFAPFCFQNAEQKENPVQKDKAAQKVS